MNNNFVDIILPNFNKATYLKEAVDSIFEQTYENWKLYIIDDCSTDKSKIILEKFKNSKKVKIIYLNKNMGPSFCRNYGIRISSSKYISFMDSDDYWTKDKLQEQISFMEKNNFKFTYTDYIPFFEKNGKKKFINKTTLKSSLTFEDFILNTSINTTTMIISRTILKHLKFKKLKKLEDYLFKCEILKQNIVAHKLNKSLAFYRILNKSRSSHKFKNIFYLWRINKKFNQLNTLKNLKSIIMISINSLKKYGFK
tara:strand:+ start:98 stop:859 length:762 start_codon:yes stop_codon:yes gene_type:complete